MGGCVAFAFARGRGADMRCEVVLEALQGGVEGVVGVFGTVVGRCGE